VIRAGKPLGPIKLRIGEVSGGGGEVIQREGTEG
jgi:hypothetical protein